MFFCQSDYMIRVTGVYRIARPAWGNRTPPRDVSVLSYRLRGSACFEQDRAVLRVTPENLLFIPPMIAYRQQSPGEELIAVHLDIPDIRERRMEVCALADPSDTAQTLCAMQRDWENGQYYACCARLYGLLDRLCVAGDTDCRGGKTSLLGPAVAAMQTEYGDPALRVPMLAQRCGLSESYFRRAFYAAYTMTPVRYLTRLRVAKAKNLLVHGVPVQDAAAACGFADVKYFSRVFHAQVGCAPSVWRDQSARSG